MNNQNGFTIIEGFIVLAIAGIISVVLYDVFFEEKIYLMKKDWECAKYEKRVHIQMIGKTLMPITSDVCVNYVER